MRTTHAQSRPHGACAELTRVPHLLQHFRPLCAGLRVVLIREVVPLGEVPEHLRNDTEKRHLNSNSHKQNINSCIVSVRAGVSVHLDTKHFFHTDTHARLLTLPHR